MFFLVSLPWLIANGRHHGSPLYNTNYLNLATEFYPELVKGKINQDGTRTMETLSFVWRSVALRSVEARQTLP